MLPPFHILRNTSSAVCWSRQKCMGVQFFCNTISHWLQSAQVVQGTQQDCPSCQSTQSSSRPPLHRWGVHKDSNRSSWWSCHWSHEPSTTHWSVVDYSYLSHRSPWLGSHRIGQVCTLSNLWTRPLFTSSVTFCSISLLMRLSVLVSSTVTPGGPGSPRGPCGPGLPSTPLLPSGPSAPVGPERPGQREVKHVGLIIGMYMMVMAYLVECTHSLL